MIDRRGSVKAAALLAPLIVSVLGLHAWGDAVAGGLGRAVGNWQYPQRDHAIFQIRVPRRSDDVDAFAARALQEFVAEAVRVHGRDLGVKTPTEPVKVVLLDLDTDVRRYRWSNAELILNGNEGLYEPAVRTIYVRMERKLQQDAVIAALRQAAARAMLHDAGSARWAPWLTEGLVGRLEGAKPSALRSPPGTDPQTLRNILEGRPADFHGHNGAAYIRGAKLLVAFLMETRSAEFAAYYQAVREGQPAPDSLLSNDSLEGDWKRWIQDQK
jgi:hypothetical protein